MVENKTTTTLEAKDWHLLPMEAAATQEEQVEVGVIEIHPNNQKIVYATRRRSDQSRDLGKEFIIVQDITRNNNHHETTTTNPILCSFTLRELTKHLNQFREESYLSSISDIPNAEEILKGGHMNAVTSLSVPLLSVQLLGAVQHVSFLDREALRYTLAPGLIGGDENGDDDDDGYCVERLLIGFRRCMVVLSIINNNSNNNTTKLHVEAFIGPDNVDEYENDSKIQKRQPSSFAIPISEHILAYGCYDGGIRFYDIQKRKQVKACLGPNGRTNPIVKMVNANPNPTVVQQQQQQSYRRPRIVSACVSANAYVWELDISIDLPTGEIYHFDIPPPVACLDGMVAAVSARGVPVTYPPPLSPTTRATLSPCSSWDQTDLLHEQFQISYDAHQDMLCFVFSPDCIGTSLNPHATRHERLDLNGALAFWNLSNLPVKAWPPPSVAPLAVTSLPRTKHGRVTSDLVLPGYYFCCSDGIIPSSLLITLYATTANEIAAAITRLKDDTTTDCVQKGVSTAVLTDLSTLQLVDGHHHPQNGFECHSLTFSSSDPTIIALGTQHGTLLARVTEDRNATSSPSVATTTTSSEDVPDEKEKPLVLLDENDRIDENNVNELMSLMNVSTNNDCSEQEHFAETKDSYLDNDGNVTGKMDQLHRFNETDSLRMSVTATDAAADVEKLKEELRNALELLEESKEKNKELVIELATAEKKAESYFRLSGGHSSNMFDASMKEPRALLGAIDDDGRQRRLSDRVSDALSLEESEVTSHHDEGDDVSELTGDYVQTMHEENADLRRQVHEMKANKDDVSDICNDGDLFQQVECEKLHKQLSIAKETEQALRDYIELLEQNKDAVEFELESARQDAEKNAALVENLQTDVYEQKLALTEMANLLEEQQQIHAEAIARMNNEPQTSRSEDTDETDEVISNLEDENARLKEEVALHIAMTTEMKVELQNALNELAELRR